MTKKKLRFVEKLLCNVCRSEVFGLWKDPKNAGNFGEQDYVHRKSLSAFCDYKQEKTKAVK